MFSWDFPVWEIVSSAVVAVFTVWISIWTSNHLAQKQIKISENNRAADIKRSRFEARVHERKLGLAALDDELAIIESGQQSIVVWQRRQSFLNHLTVLTTSDSVEYILWLVKLWDCAIKDAINENQQKGKPLGTRPTPFGLTAVSRNFLVPWPNWDGDWESFLNKFDQNRALTIQLKSINL